MNAFLLCPGTALEVFVHYQENLTFGVSQGRTEFDGAVMNILFSYFLPLSFFFSSFPFHHLLSSQERNFWTINLSYTHTLPLSNCFLCYLYLLSWKHMENIYAIWIDRVYAFLLPPSTEMKGLWSPESKLCLCLCLESISRAISWCWRWAQEGGRKKESTCLCLDGYSVLWNGFLHCFQSLRKKMFSLGYF